MMKSLLIFISTMILGTVNSQFRRRMEEIYGDGTLDNFDKSEVMSHISSSTENLMSLFDLENVARNLLKNRTEEAQPYLSEINHT